MVIKKHNKVNRNISDFQDDFSENKENGCSNTDVLQDRLTQLSGKFAVKVRA